VEDKVVVVLNVEDQEEDQVEIFLHAVEQVIHHQLVHHKVTQVEVEVDQLQEQEAEEVEQVLLELQEELLDQEELEDQVQQIVFQIHL
jgi:ribosome-binding ATPase YchF (GTP1/OBG family)